MDEIAWDRLGTLGSIRLVLGQNHAGVTGTLTWRTAAWDGKGHSGASTRPI